jgi:hypothetical protein
MRYSITSSARASTDDGMSSPSALVVLRLMAKTNFVGFYPEDRTAPRLCWSAPGTRIEGAAERFITES